MPLVPAQCYERTVRVNVPSGFGSGFTINRHGQQWLVTASHVVEGVTPAHIEIVKRDGPVSVHLEPVPSAQPGADVAVFLLGDGITPDLTLHAASDGAVFSQEAYFLGFPYGLGLQTAGITYPFVKHSLLSAFARDLNGVQLWLLDGINNPGFSGGPVVFQKSGTRDWHVAAVVSAYRTEQVAVLGGVGEVPVNTGIVLAYDVRHATDSIDAFKGSA